MTKEAYPKIYLYRRIVQSKLFIDTNFADNINLGNIADEAFFSKFHFMRLFKKIYGNTPHQYLTQVRIEKAKQLLKENNAVSSVCFSVGFDSVSSFTGLFKKATGLTPSVFQNQQRALRADIEKSPLKYIPNCFAEKKGWIKNSNFQEAAS
jgi:AraC-like DNA-binding protein